MSGLVFALALAAMLIGVAGTVIPLLPGTALVWAAGIVAWWTAGFGPAGVVTSILLTALLAGGVTAKFVLPTRTGRELAVPRRSLAIGLAAAVAGFVVVPVVGFVLGGVLGIYGAERRRTGDHDTALRRTTAMLRSFGIGLLVEVATALAMVVVFVAGVLASW